MITILQIVPTLGRAGTESFVMNCYRAINRNEFKFVFLSLSDVCNDYEQEILDLGGDVHYCNISISSVYSIPRNFIKTILCLKNLNYDILHCHKSLDSGFFFLASCLVGKRKCIAHSHFSEYEHGVGNFFRRSIYDIFFPFLTRKLSDVLCACSENAGLALYGSKIPFTIIRNSINLERFRNIRSYDIDSVRNELNILPGTRVFANISRFDNNKNISFVVDVFNEIHKSTPSSILIIGGKKADKYEATIAKVKEYGLSDSVRVLDMRSDLNVILQIVDCVIFPSLNEGFPFFPIEAQASSVHVLASDTITSSIDLGLGLVSFLNLQSGASVWAHAADNKIRVEIEGNIIRESLISNGLDLNTTIGDLQKIYYNLANK